MVLAENPVICRMLSDRRTPNVQEQNIGSSPQIKEKAMTVDERELNGFLVPDVGRPDWKAPLGEAFDRALGYLEGLPDRPVRITASLAELRTSLGGPIPEGPY